MFGKLQLNGFRRRIAEFGFPARVSFDSYLALSDGIYKSVGLRPYEKTPREEKSRLMQVFCAVGIVNLMCVFVAELMFTTEAVRNGEYLSAITNTTYMTYTIVAGIKMANFANKRPQLTILMRQLKALYPPDMDTNAELQAEYNIRRVLRNYRWISVVYIVVNVSLIWIYNLTPAVNLLIGRFLVGDKDTPAILPYGYWQALHLDSHWSFCLFYLSDILAGHMALNFQLGNDVLLGVTATQLIMHMRHLAGRIERYAAGQPGRRTQDDLQFMAQVIIQHQKIISISHNINDVFGISLFCNFISSTFTICFLCFQVTVTDPGGNPFILIVFLFCSLMQIFIICSYGQHFITRSENIGHAIYNHDWFAADLRYKKMMVLVIHRAQDPLILKGTQWVYTSLDTMTNILRFSYRFFALLHSLYTK